MGSGTAFKSNSMPSDSVVKDNTSYFSDIPDWCVLKDALCSAASGRLLPPGGSGGGSSGGVGVSGGGGNRGCGIDEALRLRSSTSNIMVDGGRAVPAVTFQALTLRGGVVEIGGGPTMVGGNASEIQQGGAVAPAGGGASGVNWPSGEKGATPLFPEGSRMVRQDLRRPPEIKGKHLSMSKWKMTRFI